MYAGFLWDQLVAKLIPFVPWESRHAKVFWGTFFSQRKESAMAKSSTKKVETLKVRGLKQKQESKNCYRFLSHLDSI